ncbi:MAG: hypothetical protein WCP95_16590 [Actinomycetes bacterium]
MSEHAAKGHTVEGLIMVLILAGLMAYLFNMISSDAVGAVGVGALLFFVGAFAVLVLGRKQA